MTRTPRRAPWGRLAAASTLALLGGCASFSSDGGFDAVAQATTQRAGQAPVLQRGAQPDEAVAARIAALLREPLTADGAAELALLGHRGLQADFAELGIAEADLVQAGRLANPSFSFGRLRGGNAVEIDRALMFDVLGLLTLPLARQVEQGRFEQAQLQAARSAVEVAAQARAAWFEAVAAQQLVGYAAQVRDAAEASHTLAQRMLAAGNFSKLAQMREQAFHADAVAQSTRAQQQAGAARERLLRALGHAGDPAAIRLPDRLPDLPAAPLEAKDAEQRAMDTRLDLLIARRQTQATADALGLGRATGFVNVLQAGVQTKSASGEPRANGYEIELQLPLFDFGQARVARAEATYRQAMHRTAQLAGEARSEVREAHAAYLGAYTLARHYRDEVVPLRQRISEENLLRYNGMLASVFDLLADTREQIASVTGAVEALRDHWIAQTRLQLAMTAGASGVAVAAH
jgi:outer membrane protein TolC